jgi:hypothetical protein
VRRLPAEREDAFDLPPQHASRGALPPLYLLRRETTCAASSRASGYMQTSRTSAESGSRVRAAVCINADLPPLAKTYGTPPWTAAHYAVTAVVDTHRIIWRAG